MTQKTNHTAWTMDVRVRDRNLRSGALTDQRVESFLTALPDLADRAEVLPLAQPALSDSSLALDDEADAEDLEDEAEGEPS